MSKTAYFSGVAIFFGVLLCISIGVDSRRIVEAAKEKFEEVDADVKKQEMRYIESFKALKGSEVADMDKLQRYLNASNPDERREAFSELKIAVGNSPELTANVVNRRNLDELNGAANRISRLEEPYAEARKNFVDACKSWQGRVAGCRS